MLTFISTTSVHLRWSRYRKGNGKGSRAQLCLSSNKHGWCCRIRSFVPRWDGCNSLLPPFNILLYSVPQSSMQMGRYLSNISIWGVSLEAFDLCGFHLSKAIINNFDSLFTTVLYVTAVGGTIDILQIIFGQTSPARVELGNGNRSPWLRCQ